MASTGATTARPFPGETHININLYRDGAVLHHAGVVAHIRADYAESERKHREALALRRTDTSPDACYDLAQTLGALSGTLLKMDRHDDAADPCEECIVYYNEIIDICKKDLSVIGQLVDCIKARVPLASLPAEAPAIVPAWIGNPQNYHGDAVGACPMSAEAKDASSSSTTCPVSSSSADAPAKDAGAKQCPFGFTAENAQTPKATVVAPATANLTGANGSRHKPGAKSSDLARLMVAAEEFNKGQQLASAGSNVEAAACFAKAAQIRKDELEDDDWYEVALALAAQGRCLLRGGQLVAAFSALSEATAVYKSVVDAMHANASGFIVFLADVRNRQQRSEDAERLLIDAMRLVLITPGKPMESYTHIKLGELYEARGQLADALFRFENGVQTMYPHQLRAPKGADALNRLGCIRLAVGNAIVYGGEDGLSIARASSGRAEGVAVSKEDAQAEAIRQYTFAVDDFARAAATYTRMFGAKHIEIATVETNAAEALQLLGRLDDALAKHSAALAIRVGAHGEQHPLVSYAYFGRGKVLLEMEKYADAKDEFISAGKAIGMRIDSVEKALEGFAPFMAAANDGTNGNFDIIQQILYGLYEVQIGLSSTGASSEHGP